MGEILLGIGICRNMQKLSHNKGGMNMYEPSTDWFGYVLSLSDEPHGGGWDSILSHILETLRCPETWLAKFPSS